jgi:hypothetical protein
MLADSRVTALTWILTSCVLFISSPVLLAATPEPDDPCTLLSLQVATTVLHGPAKLSGYQQPGLCFWQRVDDRFYSIKFQYLNFDVGVKANPPSEGFYKKPYQVVKDLGESAFWISEPGNYQLWVTTKRTAFMIVISKSPSSGPGAGAFNPIDDLPGCTAAAADIVRKLPNFHAPPN